MFFNHSDALGQAKDDRKQLPSPASLRCRAGLFDTPS
jgi:hypothetical protein